MNATNTQKQSFQIHRPTKSVSSVHVSTTWQKITYPSMNAVTTVTKTCMNNLTMM